MTSEAKTCECRCGAEFLEPQPLGSLCAADDCAERAYTREKARADGLAKELEAALAGPGHHLAYRAGETVKLAESLLAQIERADAAEKRLREYLGPSGAPPAPPAADPSPASALRMLHDLRSGRVNCGHECCLSFDLLDKIAAALAAPSEGEGETTKMLREAAYGRGWNDRDEQAREDEPPEIKAMLKRHRERWWTATHAERLADMAEYADAKVAQRPTYAHQGVADTLRAAVAALAAQPPAAAPVPLSSEELESLLARAVPGAEYMAATLRGESYEAADRAARDVAAPVQEREARDDVLEEAARAVLLLEPAPHADRARFHATKAIIARRIRQLKTEGRLAAPLPSAKPQEESAAPAGRCEAPVQATRIMPNGTEPCGNTLPCPAHPATPAHPGGGK